MSLLRRVKSFKSRHKTKLNVGDDTVTPDNIDKNMANKITNHHKLHREKSLSSDCVQDLKLNPIFKKQKEKCDSIDDHLYRNTLQMDTAYNQQDDKSEVRFIHNNNSIFLNELHQKIKERSKSDELLRNFDDTTVTYDQQNQLPQFPITPTESNQSDERVVLRPLVDGSKEAGRGARATIKTRLLRLLRRRSARDVLESKGIIKNEPIFGNTLDDLCRNGVPTFLKRLINLIELPENITSVGIYRTNGNLAVIQKIRFDIDNGKMSTLDDYNNDVDILTGTLKLFFRETKDVLIDDATYRELLECQSSEDRWRRCGDIIMKHLTYARRTLLEFLMRHLVYVCEHSDENKMDAYNMSICWAPSLVALPETCHDVVTHSGNVTRVVEMLMHYYSKHSTHETKCVRQTETKWIPKKLQRQIMMKLIEIIELHIDDDIYRKNVSPTKLERIMKSITTVTRNGHYEELDKYKNETSDVAAALMEYLDQSDILPTDIYDSLRGIRRDFHELYDRIPYDSLFYVLMRHLAYVYDHGISAPSIIASWTPILLDRDWHGYRSVYQTFGQFLEFLLVDRSWKRRCTMSLPDVLMMRVSRYDNLCDENVKGEAQLLD